MSVNATTVNTELFHSCARFRVAGGRAGGTVALTTRLRPCGEYFFMTGPECAPNQTCGQHRITTRNQEFQAFNDKLSHAAFSIDWGSMLFVFALASTHTQYSY